MNHLWRVMAIGLGVTLAACGQPNTKDLKGEAPVTVAQASAGDRVTLSDGRVVALIGVDAPRRDQPLYEDARAALERLTVGRPARLAHEGKAEVNETLGLGHLFVQTEGGRWVWVEEALLLEGLARVHTRKDGAGRANELLAAEAVARAAGRGMWAEKPFAVRDAVRGLAGLTTIADACRSARSCRTDERDGADASVAKTTGGLQKIADRPASERSSACAPARALCRNEGFQVVEGRVRKVFMGKNGAAHLDFGDPDDPQSYKTDFSIYIAPADVTAWPGGQDALKGMQGQAVRVRGLLSSFNGPSVRVDHPAQIEALATQTASAKEAAR